MKQNKKITLDRGLLIYDTMLSSWWLSPLRANLLPPPNLRENLQS